MDGRVGQVRSFNRRVTQRVGALQEHYLARRRSLGASRVLWEIGPGGTDVRSIRDRLGFDSGYLSRLLRLLEADGLVQVRRSTGDQRVRVVALTSAGQTERRELDRLSDELAWSVLEPLADRDRDRLVEAMAAVERLLTAGSVQLSVEDPATDVAQSCFRAYFDELDARFPGGFDPGTSIPARPDELTAPHGVLLVARLDDRPVGAGAAKFHDTEPAEIKRMWVSRDARGLGIARRILDQLEHRAREQGARATRLETNESLTEAIRLYRSAGYREVAPFNDEPYAHHWFEKDLTGS